MKRFSILFFFFLFSLCSFGQAEFYLLKTDKKTISIGRNGFLDPYLSELSYSGHSLGFLMERTGLLSPNQLDYSKRARIFLKAGTATNPSRTGSILFSKFRCDWGLYRHFSPAKNLILLAGGYLDLDLGVKYNARNSNNPVSFEVATNINLSLRCIYDFQLFCMRDKFRAELMFETPLIGLMFAPPQGLSYYEMSLANSFFKQIDFSSLHNKQGMRIAARLDLPLGNAVYSLGLSREKFLYAPKYIVLRESEFSFFIGYVQKFSTFGRKKSLPPNFISF